MSLIESVAEALGDPKILDFDGYGCDCPVCANGRLVIIQSSLGELVFECSNKCSFQHIADGIKAKGFALVDPEIKAAADSELKLNGHDKEISIQEKSPVLDAGDWLDTGQYEFDPLIENLFDAGDKVAIIGKSKTRKSFFAMQLLLSAVAGVPFLGFTIPKLRKALLIQYEIKESHFHRRLQRTCDSLGIHPDQLRGKLSIINARGMDLTREQVGKWVKESGAEIVLFDPIYKLMTEGENAVEDFKPLFQWFDKLAKETGAAILYVHHDRKGFTGDQDLSDRGAGSSIIGRDFDAAFFLTPHENEDLVVLETLTRNYAPSERQSVEWVQNQFMASDAPANVKTSRSKSTRNQTTLEDWVEPALGIIADGKAIFVTVFLQRLKDLGCSVHNSRAVMDHILAENKAIIDLIHNKRGPPSKLIRLVK